MHFNASSLPDENGSILSVWSDSSGNERGLNRVRGVPKVLKTTPELENKKVVSFDGLSQMYSSYDFGGLLNDYTIVAVARYTEVKTMQSLHLLVLIGFLGLGEEVELLEVG